MALIHSTSAQTATAVSGQVLTWYKDETEILHAKTPPSDYAYIQPSHEPLSLESIFVWFDGVIVHPTQWTYDTFAGFPAVRIFFPTDPSLSADGISNKLTIIYPSTQ